MEILVVGPSEWVCNSVDCQRTSFRIKSINATATASLIFFIFLLHRIWQMPTNRKRTLGNQVKIFCRRNEGLALMLLFRWIVNLAIISTAITSPSSWSSVTQKRKIVTCKVVRVWCIGLFRRPNTQSANQTLQVISLGLLTISMNAMRRILFVLPNTFKTCITILEERKPSHQFDRCTWRTSLTSTNACDRFLSTGWLRCT